MQHAGVGKSVRLHAAGGVEAAFIGWSGQLWLFGGPEAAKVLWLAVQRRCCRGMCEYGLLSGSTSASGDPAPKPRSHIQQMQGRAEVFLTGGSRRMPEQEGTVASAMQQPRIRGPIGSA